ncbi:flagellar filament capping protein FliD [Desulfobacula sp.]|uniref:flagellar filament capping protein FliD n=1 Tax=Desulfobacula sp. TaxID=2593537 RepID=UPI002618D973|nr:flagellar filament capping protein FliD [Desulfobacula sp.]
MATGSISSLGLGSGLELQSILDQLKDVETAPIRAQETQKETLQKTITAFNSVNARLFSMKSHALSLSLESDFLKNKITVSDEDVVTGRVDDGISESATRIDVTQKARANSWQSPGVASKSAMIYPAPGIAIAGADVGITDQPDTMTIKYGAEGAQKDIHISLGIDMSLNEMADAVNASANNRDTAGNQLVTASVEKNSDGLYYIRLKATNGGNTADSQISISGFEYVKSDATIAIAKASDTTQSAYISIAPGTTYQAAADAINGASDNPGVMAAIIDDGSAETPYKLILTATSTGEDNRISIQNLPMTEVTGQNGDSLNAALTVNGITFQRQSNDGIDDILTGATLTLKKTGEATISVQNDMDSVKQHILDLVEEFNALVGEIKGTTPETVTETAEAETEAPLKDVYAAKKTIADLYTLIGSTISTGGDYSSLYDLGMTIDRDGIIHMDETELDQAIAADPEGVKTLFLGQADDDIKGLGDTINDGITNMISISGSVTTQIDAAEQKMERLDKDIATATERLTKRYAIMTSEFARLDSYINQLNNEAALLTSIIDSFNDAKNT